jgi:pimeloyl-ACP methyl ester carboxylesterase
MTDIDMAEHATDFLAPSTVSFISGGLRCYADCYRPLGAGPFPMIVMAHGLGGTRKMRLPAFAERFAVAGYACMVFDYRHFGDSEGSPRQLLDIAEQLEDWKAAIAYARGLKDIDPKRIILWGTSFGGGHVLATAANDNRITAVISQCPFTDGLSSSLAMSPMTSLKLTALALRDRIGSWLGAPPVMVPLAGKPGETALMNAPDVYPGYMALQPPGSDIPNYVAARVALDIIRYYPGRRTAEISSPILFCVCDTDTVAPAKATLRHAYRAPHKEIKRYADGHFEIYIGNAFERVLSDQLDFLTRTVPV